MNENRGNLETVQKKLEDLDSELNTFLQSMLEIKEIRSSVGDLPERLKQREKEIESQKKELDNLMSTTKNVVMSIEEQTKGLMYDLGKKTDAMANEIKTRMSQINDLFGKTDVPLHDQQMEELAGMARKVESLDKSLGSIISMIEAHESSIESVKNNYIASSIIFEKMEASIAEMKRNISELQKRPYYYEFKIKKMEDHLTELFMTTLERQKKAIMITMAIVLLIVFLYIFNIYLK